LRISDSATVGPSASSRATFLVSSANAASSQTRFDKSHSRAFSAGKPFAHQATVRSPRALPIMRGKQPGRTAVRHQADAAKGLQENRPIFAHRIMSPIKAKLMPAPAATPLTDVTIDNAGCATGAATDDTPSLVPRRHCFCYPGHDIIAALQIGAGAKRPPGAGDDKAADFATADPRSHRAPRRDRPAFP